MPKEIWSLFSGAMGLDLGLEAAGLKPTLAVELDGHCCETIRLNRPSLTVLQADISSLSAADLFKARAYRGKVHAMVGGPPCQSFSPAGKRAALSDPRGNLIYEYLRLIDEVSPDYFALENVANLATAALRHRPIALRPGKRWSLKSYSKVNTPDAQAMELDPDEMSGSAVRQILQDVEKLGYNVTFSIVDAADYGAPQHRLRFIMLGSRKGRVPVLPAPTHGPNANPIAPFVTVRDAIADLADSPGEHSTYTESVAKYFRQIPPGGNWRSLPPDLQREALGGSFDAGGGKTGFFRRLAWDAPAPTLTGKANRKGSALCHPDATRALSTLEYARIQGFPDDWRFVGSMNRVYLQIGNAVPVALGRAVGEAILSVASSGVLPSALVSHELMLDRALVRLRASARNKISRRSHPDLFESAV